jgi:RNA recognition motif-containing protein
MLNSVWKSCASTQVYEWVLVMGAKLLIGNLPVEATQTSLKELFDRYGTVKDVTIPLTAHGKGRGFAFVEMSARPEAVAASRELNNFEFCGRRLTVSLKKEEVVERSGIFGFLKSFRA